MGPFGKNILQKMVEKIFQNCSYRDDDITDYVNFFEKLCEKWLKYVFFKSTSRKKIFKNFFRFLKVEITYKSNIYRLILKGF